jgi:hypothetical protein
VSEAEADFASDYTKNIGDIDVCTEFEMLVKLTLPIILLGIVGFSPLRKGRSVYST